MEDFEKLGVFYLGRPWDLRAHRPKTGLLLYDAKDLVTHAVCIGMTGSGKTGLCLALLEEALIDGIPALIIDPKGDLANLLLTFPDLRAQDFAPWVDADEARKKGLTVEAYAAEQAERWKKGLTEWGQSGDRIRRLRAAADFAIYTPGSTAGLPVSVLRSFAAPGPVVWEDKDLLHERISTTATSLLSLLGLAPLPAAAGRPKSYEGWRKDLVAWLCANRRLELFRHAASKTLSRTGESERDFRIRLGGDARQQRDEWTEALRKKYAPRTAALEERLRRARQAVAREQEQVTQQGLQTVISVGATLLGAFLGRKKVSATNLGRATTAARGVGRVLKERQDVDRSEETVEVLEQQLADLDAEFKAELAVLESRANPLTDPLETVALTPKRTNVTVQTCALVWAPHRSDATGAMTPVWT